MRETQFTRILALYDHAEWVCQADFWTISKSPHKRRSDLEKKGYKFEDRPCQHGIKGSKDFKLHSLPERVVERIFIQAPQLSLGLPPGRLSNYH